MDNNFIFSKQIIFWYFNTKTQSFPWQHNKTLYNVWLSEIMLQQTQVKTVISYYKKFIKKFPTIDQLAIAEINEILYLWSGLGYYKRAINLHKTAKIIVEKYAGKFPKELKILISLPGIGKSTAGAILSLALNQRHPILDGNIKRILIRYYDLNQTILKKSALNNKLWVLINSLIPNENISTFNQAMMDLGRLICTHKRPICRICPINNCCQFFLKEKDKKTPILKNRYIKKIKRIIWWLLLIFKENQTIWLIKRSQSKIWQGLFCFPEFDNYTSLHQWLFTHHLHNHKHYDMKILNRQISNIYLEIHPVLTYIDNMNNILKKDGICYNLYEPSIIGLPKPVLIILEKLRSIDINKIKLNNL